MEKVKNIKDVRDTLAEVAEVAWKDKTFLPRAIVVINAMGKINATIAQELKAAELSKKEPSIDFLKY